MVSKDTHIWTGETSNAPVGLVASRYDDMDIAANNAKRHVVTNVERLFKR